MARESEYESNILKRYICILGIISLITVLALLALWGRYKPIPISEAENAPERNISENSPIPTSDSSPTLDVWLKKLENMENCSPTGTPDSGSLSYGKFCYKFDTFKRFVRQYELLPDTEDVELMNWIGDPEFQTELTKLVILYEKPSVVEGMWRTTITTRGLGLPSI